MSFCGVTDEEYMTFTASNGVDVISRSRMDIQTDRLWLVGCKPNERSGSMVFSSDEKRDREFDRFQKAILEWAASGYFSDKTLSLKELGNEAFEV